MMSDEDEKTKSLSGDNKQNTDQTTKRNATGDTAYQKALERYPRQKGV